MRRWDRLELALGLALTVVSLAARLVAYLHAGGLWRDEVHSVNMASQSDYFGTWTNDSFPILWLLALRGWIALGLGETDTALRGIGLVCGASHVAAAWWTGRQLGARVPWVLLMLLCFQPTLIVYGDEVRGYGLGALTQLLLVGCLWRALKRPTWRRFVVLQIAALLAVQSLYANSFMLLAACMGGGLVCLRRRDGRALIGIALVGFVSAVSVAPYVLYLFPKTSEWTVVVRQDVPWSWQLAVFGKALGAAGPAGCLAWGAAALFALAAAVWVFLRGKRVAFPSNHRDLAVFLLGNALVGTVGFWWYIRFVHVPTQVWYYLPFMTLLAVTVEMGAVLGATAKPTYSIARLAAVTLVFGGVLGHTWSALAFRFTNVDLVVERLDREARRDDLIVIHPWYVGLTFERYYRGEATAMNFPDVEKERKGHGGYLEMKRKMELGDPIRGELERFEQTLRAGGRIWLVGRFEFMPRGARPLVLPPAPHPQYGWNEGIYGSSWSQQAAYLLQSHAGAIREVPLPAPGRVNPLENVPLLLIEGWREQAMRGTWRVQRRDRPYTGRSRTRTAYSDAPRSRGA